MAYQDLIFALYGDEKKECIGESEFIRQLPTMIRRGPKEWPQDESVVTEAMIMLFGLQGNRIHTLNELSTRYGYTRELIRARTAKWLRQLRRHEAMKPSNAQVTGASPALMAKRPVD